MKVSFNTTYEHANLYRIKAEKKETISFNGSDYLIGALNYIPYPANCLVELVLQEYKQPKSEQELQLEQTIKLTEQDIHHKQLLIEGYEAKRVELEKKRLNVGELTVKEW